MVAYSVLFPFLCNFNIHIVSSASIVTHIVNSASSSVSNK